MKNATWRSRENQYQFAQEKSPLSTDAQGTLISCSYTALVSAQLSAQAAFTGGLVTNVKK